MNFKSAPSRFHVPRTSRPVLQPISKSACLRRAEKRAGLEIRGTAGPEVCAAAERGSVLILVLWMALGLVGIVLYFANTTSFELRAADNRTSAVATDQAIEGAARYISYVLTSFNTNGAFPDPSLYLSEAVEVGDCRFWLIGRDTNDPPARPDEVFFGLVDESSKLNINDTNTSLEMLEWLPRITYEFAANMMTWRSTNADLTVDGVGSETYGMMSSPYYCKGAPFESIEELRLVHDSDLDMLFGEDLNRNGILDPNETDLDRNGQASPGLTEYVTIYTREPNLRADGTRKVNLNNRQELSSFLATNLSNANQVLQVLSNVTVRSPLEFYARLSAQNLMSADQFAEIANEISVVTNDFIEGRINVNTASAAVLACLPGFTNRAEEVVNFRTANSARLTSVAWVLEALSLSGPDAVQFARNLRDRITTQSYQFTADVAAVGPHGRGYRRVRFVFDTSEGTPKIIYRRDLTHLGWALGKEVRERWLTQNSERSMRR